MPVNTTVEEGLLRPAHQVVEKACLSGDLGGRVEGRRVLLEAAAAELGGFDLERYWSDLGFAASAQQTRIAEERASRLVACLKSLSIPTSLALTALARPETSQSDRRTSGAYYTDFRLAGFLA